MSFYHTRVPPYKLRREEKSWGVIHFFLTSFINLKVGAIIAAEWKYIMRIFPVYKDCETRECNTERIVKYHSLGRFKNKLVPVFLIWQKFRFPLRGIVSKLIIFRFIKEIIYYWNYLITLPICRCLELGQRTLWH